MSHVVSFVGAGPGAPDLLTLRAADRLNKADVLIWTDSLVSFVFRTFYNMIKPFVDPVTKQKVCWCVGKQGLEQIVDDVGGAEMAGKQLEKCCGGGDVRDFDSVEYNQQPLNVAFDEGVNY